MTAQGPHHPNAAVLDVAVKLIDRYFGSLLAIEGQGQADVGFSRRLAGHRSSVGVNPAVMPSRLRAWILAPALAMLWTIIGISSAWSDCPAGQMPAPGNACVCSPFATPTASGGCLCANGSQPAANGACPAPNQCLLSASCCPPGQQTNTGTCCPQGQIPLSDGSCALFNWTIARLINNQGLCPLSQVLQSNGTCLGYPGTSACTYASQPPPLMAPTTIYGGPVPGPTPCCLPGQIPAVTGVAPSDGYGGTLTYTGTCCPVGQVPQADWIGFSGSCVPWSGFVRREALTKCPGGAPFNPQTHSCCPAGTGSLSNRYECCPRGLAPQPNGTCGCGPTQVTQSDGSCLPKCPSNMIPGRNDACRACPTGQIGTLQGVCCDPAHATDRGFCCPSGYYAQGSFCHSEADIRRAGIQPYAPARPPARVNAAVPTGCGARLVPREAVEGDRVCVTVAVHDQAAADNMVAATRINPDGNCLPGYVWREANASDHVCVTQMTHDQTIADNERAEIQLKGPPGGPASLGLGGGFGTGIAVAPQPVSIAPSCGAPGYSYNPFTQSCTGPANGCPAGTTLLTNTSPPTPAPFALGCCPAGSKDTGAGTCLASGGVEVAPVAPTCPNGATLGQLPWVYFCSEPPTCPGLTVFNQSSGTCVFSPTVLSGVTVGARLLTARKCEAGFVPRAAFAGDKVCVTAAVRDQVLDDNAAAPTRVKPDGNCIEGYVWREANPSDHVCVTPQTRAQTRHDNAAAVQPVSPAPCPAGSTLITFMQGTAPQCVISACPSGMYEWQIGCCPNGMTPNAANNTCIGSQGTVTPTTTPACPSGWSLFGVPLGVPQLPARTLVCIQPPSCTPPFVLRDDHCVAIVVPRRPGELVVPTTPGELMGVPTTPGELVGVPTTNLRVGPRYGGPVFRGGTRYRVRTVYPTRTRTTTTRPPRGHVSVPHGMRHRR